MNSRHINAPVVLATIAMTIALLMLPWRTLGLSLRSLAILRATMSHVTPGVWPSLSPESRLRLCPTYVKMPSAEMLASGEYRLVRHVFMSCVSTEAVFQWARATVATEFAPDTMAIIYLSQILDDGGATEAAMSLRQMDSDVAVWYAEQGRLSIALHEDEVTAKRYFQLAQDVDPELHKRKAHMYLYLCMEAIRVGKPSVMKAPCEALESVDKSVVSETLLGQKLVLGGAPERAIPHLQWAIELDQSKPVAYYWYGMAFVSLKDTGRARQVLREGNRLAEKYPPISLELARLEIADGCYTSARKLLSAIQADDNPQIVDQITSMLSSLTRQPDTGTACE